MNIVQLEPYQIPRKVFYQRVQIDGRVAWLRSEPWGAETTWYWEDCGAPLNKLYADALAQFFKTQYEREYVEKRLGDYDKARSHTLGCDKKAVT